MREGGDGEDGKLGFSSEKMLADLQNQIDREEISPMKTHPTAKDEEEEKERMTKDLLEEHARRLEEERHYLDERLQRYRDIFEGLQAKVSTQ